MLIKFNNYLLYYCIFKLSPFTVDVKTLLGLSINNIIIESLNGGRLTVLISFCINNEKIEIFIFYYRNGLTFRLSNEQFEKHHYYKDFLSFAKSLGNLLENVNKI